MAEVCSCAWLYLQLRHAPKRLRKIEPMGDGCISRRRIVITAMARPAMAQVKHNRPAVQLTSGKVTWAEISL
jgi:hypothetical protein